MPGIHLPGLWQHRDFMKLWAGQSVSLMGSQVSQLAVPLVAVMMLRATPAEMGYLNALQMAPFLGLSLFAGVWLDRMRRRPVLVGADVLRMVFMGFIPILGFMGVLRMADLDIIMLLVGICTVFFDVAYQSYLPALVGRKDLVEGNAKLESTRSVSSIAGPAVAGFLVQVLSASAAILVDACSYIVSFVSLLLIRAPEPHPAEGVVRQTFWQDLGEGLGTITKDRYLSAIARCTGTSNFFSSAGMSVFVLYAVHQLGFSAALLGTVFAIGSVGGLLGSLVSRRAGDRFGFGHTVIGSILFAGLGGFLFPLAFHPGIPAIVLVSLGEGLVSFGSVIYNVTQVSFRQTITPDKLLGRMNASMRFIVWGTMPLGSLLGGTLGTWIGLRPTLAVAAMGALLSVVWVVLSPLRSVHSEGALSASA